MQNLFNFLDHFFQAAPELVGAGQVLEMSPETFDRVQLGTVSWEPEDQDSVLKEAQSSQSRCTLMVRSAIQNQDDATRRIFFDQQIFQEGNENFAVLPLGNHPFDLVTDPVVGSKNMTALFLLISGQRDTLLHTHFHPARSQHGVQTQGRFVHKEELEIVLEDPFFSSSNSSRACSLASGSCK